MSYIIRACVCALYYIITAPHRAYHYDIGCGDIEGQGEGVDQRCRRARGTRIGICILYLYSYIWDAAQDVCACAYMCFCV